MTSPTRQEIIEANNALAALICFAHSHTEEADEMDWIMTKGRAIAAVLPPKPQPTMAEIEWDDDVHYLAEAEHADGYKVSMLKPVRAYPQIKCLSAKDDGCCILYLLSEDLTPTGRRYTLTEVQE